jgi:ribosome-associated protein
MILSIEEMLEAIMKEFILEKVDYIALCDLLKAMSFCGSGGQAKFAIFEGNVKVDGKIELRKKCKIRAGSIVEYSGQIVKVVGLS